MRCKPRSLQRRIRLPVGPRLALSKVGNSSNCSFLTNHNHFNWLIHSTTGFINPIWPIVAKMEIKELRVILSDYFGKGWFSCVSSKMKIAKYWQCCNQPGNQFKAPPIRYPSRLPLREGWDIFFVGVWSENAWWPVIRRTRRGRQRTIGRVCSSHRICCP